MTTATILAHTIASHDTGLTYEVELDTAAAVATFRWLDADGIDQTVESAAPGGVLAACDVPAEDAGLLASVVAWLDAGSPREATFDLEFGSEVVNDFFTVRLRDGARELEVSFPTRDLDDPAEAGFFPEEEIMAWASMALGMPLALEGGAIDAREGVTTEVWTFSEASLG